jgi:hypothetical protein
VSVEKSRLKSTVKITTNIIQTLWILVIFSNNGNIFMLFLTASGILKLLKHSAHPLAVPILARPIAQLMTQY